MIKLKEFLTDMDESKINESKPKELIDNKDWWKRHDKGPGWFATVKAIHKKTKEKRFFISSESEVKKYLGKDWGVFSI